MSSAEEAELGVIFINMKTAVSMCRMLMELGHPQPHTPMQTNNAMAHALLTIKILPKALKAMDKCFHWLRCRNAQGQFCYYWRPGTQNLADYFTKHHPTSHHKSVRPTILTFANNPKHTKLFKTSTTPVTATNQKIGINKIICQESTTNTKVQDHGHQHSHSKKCLNIPTARVC
jgi:hypothetical protein